METLEASTSTEISNFNVLPWEDPLACMDVIYFHQGPWNYPWEHIYFYRLPRKNRWKIFETSTNVCMKVSGKIRGSRSNGSRWTLMKVLWKQLKVGGVRGNRWKYVGANGCSWKLPRNTFVEDGIDGTNGNFHFHQQRKRPCFSMEVPANLH